MSNERIKTRLRAMLMILNDPASAYGERQNAQMLIDRLCEKYEVDINTLMDDATEQREYSYKTSIERQLLVQLYGYVVNSNSVEYSRYRGGRSLIFDLTVAQHIELQTMYDHYRVALNDAIQDCVSAFFISNNLFADPSDDNDDDESVDWNRIERLVNMASGIKPSSPRKQIES